MFARLKSWFGGIRLSLRTKMLLSLSAIVVVLVLTSVISILEYRRMSNYMSELIAGDINSINVAQKLASVTDAYNLQILTVIGDDSVNSLPDFDQQKFVFYCDSLKSSFTQENMIPLADSVLSSYSRYMKVSMDLEKVLFSEDDTRVWYFDTLQPSFNALRSDIEKLNGLMFDELRTNSADYDRGFYRSMVPSAVAVAVGVLLIFLLMFFILVYYVDPLCKMLSSLENYKSIGKKYTCNFEGDDELSRLNGGIMDLTEENRQLRRRIKDLKEKSGL